MIRKFNGKRSIPAIVLRDLYPVQINFGAVACCTDTQDHSFSRPRLRDRDHAAISADHLVNAFVEVIIGSLAACVGQFDFFESRNGSARQKRFVKGFGKAPASVQLDSQDPSSSQSVDGFE